MVNQITKDMIISDVLEIDPELAQYLLEMGMHCLGCPAARGETLEEACQVHEADIDELLEKINAHLAS